MDEARRHQVEAVLRLLHLRQRPEGTVGEPEDVTGDVHEPGRRPERFGQTRVGPLHPVERLVQVGVDVDDPHACSLVTRTSGTRDPTSGGCGRDSWAGFEWQFESCG